MLTIKKKYVVDENEQKVAVQLDIETFRRIEQILEDYALGKLIQENDLQNKLSLPEAKDFYTDSKG
jgi:hypothetical protein